jgi:predicted site-specific integrase-resolvase
LLAAFRTPGGHRRYSLTAVLAFCNGTTSQASSDRDTGKHLSTAISYARVSSSKQKDDLARQESHLEGYIHEQGWQLVKRYRDTGSGLNGKRKGLLTLLRDLPVIQPDYLVCSYGDRLSRFGTEVIHATCRLFDTEIIITQDNNVHASIDDQLVKDVIALITSFAGKLYRRRRGQQNVV